MSAETEGRAAADRFRQEYHLGTQTLGDLVALIEQTIGVDVAVLDVGPGEHGLTMRDPDRGAVFIAVARTRSPMRQRSTLAHELAHVVFEDWTTEPDMSSNNPQESRANAFARHLLIPEAEVRNAAGESHPVDLGVLSKVVQRFEVSPSIATIAFERAGCIDPKTKAYWQTLSTPNLAARYGWSDHYHSLQLQSDQRRAPQKLLTRTINAYLDNVVSVQTIATLRGMDVELVEAELREANLVPRTLSPEWAAPTKLADIEIDLSQLDFDETGEDSAI